MEMPIMPAVTIVAARWIALHFAISSEALVRLGVSGIALGFVLVAEFGCVLYVHGLSTRQWLRDQRSCIRNGLLRYACSVRSVRSLAASRG